MRLLNLTFVVVEHVNKKMLVYLQGIPMSLDIGSKLLAPDLTITYKRELTRCVDLHAQRGATTDLMLSVFHITFPLHRVALTLGVF